MEVTDQDYLNIAPTSRNGLINIVSNSAIMEMERKAAETEREQTRPEITTLSSYISECYARNKRQREASGVESEMISCLEARNSEYSASKLAKILKQGGTEVFIGLTGVKCRAAEAWLGDVLSTKPWRLKPSAIPDLPVEVESVIVNRVMAQYQKQLMAGQNMNPDQVYQMASDYRDTIDEDMKLEAETRAKKMETKIQDQMMEGKWEDSFDAFVTNAVTLKAGFIKGPILKKRKRLKWKKAAFGGKTVPQVVDDVQYVYEAPSPFDMYPEDGMTDCQDGTLIERMKLSPKHLAAMKGVPGYDTEAINLVLSRYGQGGLRSWTGIDSLRASLEDKGDTLTAGKDLIEALEFWGSVQGKFLIERGMYEDLDKKPIDPMKLYEINAIQIGPYLIYAQFNPDPLSRRPYSHTGWAKVPGSFWFKGIPELMKDLQSICNATVRALVNNLAIGSGPQVVINDINRIAKGENVSSMFPWKIWQFINNARSQLKAIDFFQPKVYAKELLAVYDQFAKLADDFTGIPAYAYGNDKVAGAGRTASGLSMLMNSAARGIKKVIMRIDREVLRPTLRRQYDNNMLYDEDESIKGDVEIQPRGALAMIIKEQMAAQRMEFLNATANPVDSQIMGLERRANVLRQIAEPLQMEEEDIVPSKQEVKIIENEWKKQQAMAQQAEMEKVAA